MSDIDKDKWIDFINKNSDCDFMAGNPKHFTPSQLIGSEDIDDAYDSLFYEYKALQDRNKLLEEVVEAAKIINNTRCSTPRLDKAISKLEKE